MHDTGEEREGMESSVEAGGMAPRPVVIQGNKDAGRWRGGGGVGSGNSHCVRCYFPETASHQLRVSIREPVLELEIIMR